MKFTLIDSHAHVQFAAYDEDRDLVLQRAKDAGIGVINIGTQYKTSESALRLAEQREEGVWATAGFHPNHATHDPHHDPWEVAEEARETFEYQRFLSLARSPKIVAIGECGLDYYRTGRGQGMGDRIQSVQRELFQKHIELAREIQKPLVIHCRDAFGDLIEVLSATRHSLTPHGNGVVHFFSGSRDDARKLIELGFFLGFGGVITFARDYDDVIKYAPIDRILVETDAPYVAPVPYRGKRNEPAYVIEVVKQIAELKGIRYDDVAEKTRVNTQTLFQLTI